ncbi:transmembrane protein 126 isoform X2 [Oratosquilla oratoria]|uniref:transmembrane protein 126 isoform X2 n=1 Tax=Oratosquilla oratoria TaxID=337810 RepID=UPI003F774036
MQRQVTTSVALFPYNTTRRVLNGSVYPFTLFGSVSAAYINTYFRKAVKLRQHGFLSTFIPTVILPSITGTILHHQFVFRPLILQKFDCPVCLELRGGALQLFAGFVYPFLLAPAASFHFAQRLYTYHMPSIVENPKGFLQEFVKITRKGMPKFYGLAALQVLCGMAVTHMEALEYFNLMQNLKKVEKFLEEHPEVMGDK